MGKYNITERTVKKAAYRSMINPKLMKELQSKIINVIADQKKYRDKNYSAKKLAEDLGTNTRYISAAVNVTFNMNYSSFVNRYRIAEAMKLLGEARNKSLNMEDISDMVGFSNRQSFYAAFYRINHCTPREYKLSQLQKTQLGNNNVQMNAGSPA